MPAPERTAAHEVEFYGPVRLADTARAIAAGALTCVTAVERCLDRARVTEPAIAAWLRLDPDRALVEARALDRELAERGPRGPLHGVPVAVKDIIDVAGFPTTAGSRVLADAPPATRDAEIVAALRARGAIILGKANTHEFAYGATTPPTRNPSDPSGIAGGSSGGSAAAVAAGSAVLALGSDTGGSVRLPAALCGVAGWRPLRNPEIGIGGIVPLASEFDEWGLIAAAAADLALARAALRNTEDIRPSVSVVVVPDDVTRALPGTSGDVARAFAAAVERLRSRGIEIVYAGIPDLGAWRAPRMAIQMRQVLEHHTSMGWWPDRRDLYGEESRLNIEAAEARKDEDLEPHRRELRELDARIDRLLEHGRVLATPTTPVIAPKAADIARMKHEPGKRHPIVGLLALATLPFSRAGLTTLTVPADSGEDGMPVGLQFVARDELALFAAAARFEGSGA